MDISEDYVIVKPYLRIKQLVTESLHSKEGSLGPLFCVAGYL